MYFSEKNKRVFNVKFGEKRVKEKIDVAGTVGKYAAYDEYIPFELRNEMIYFQNELCPSSYHPESG